MYLLETMYPLSLASANLVLGWLLYHLSEPGLGVFLALIGIFVILAAVGGTLIDLLPRLKTRESHHGISGQE
jgi:hypothetical protein